MIFDSDHPDFAQDGLYDGMATKDHWAGL